MPPAALAHTPALAPGLCCAAAFTLHASTCPGIRRVHPACAGIDYVNTAMDRLVKNDVHYRWVQPLLQINAQAGAAGRVRRDAASKGRIFPTCPQPCCAPPPPLQKTDL